MNRDRLSEATEKTVIPKELTLQYWLALARRPETETGRGICRPSKRTLLLQVTSASDFQEKVELFRWFTGAIPQSLFPSEPRFTAESYVCSRFIGV